LLFHARTWDRIKKLTETLDYNLADKVFILTVGDAK